MKKRNILLIVLSVLVFGYVCAVIGYNLKGNEAKTDKPPTIRELLTLVNKERAKVGVAPLTIDPRLNASAQMKANDMAQYNYFSHTSPSSSPYANKKGYTFVKDVGAKCLYQSENILEIPRLRSSTTTTAINVWVGSPSHYKAMIDKKYSATGFGINGDYLVEHFCQAN